MPALLSDSRYSCCHVAVVAVFDIDCAPTIAIRKHVETHGVSCCIRGYGNTRGIEDAVGDIGFCIILRPAYQPATFIYEGIAVGDAAREDAAAHVECTAIIHLAHEAAGINVISITWSDSYTARTIGDGGRVGVGATHVTGDAGGTRSISGDAAHHV